MPQTTITVAGILPPGQGKKQGKVKDTAGGSWNVWGDKLHLFQMGATYDINYEENSFNNTTFYLIKSFAPASTAGATPAPQPRPATLPSAMPVTSKDEQIFVCGALNNALANPNVSPFQLQTTDMVNFVNLIRHTWRQTLGKAQQNNAMDDEIPF